MAPAKTATPKKAATKKTPTKKTPPSTKSKGKRTATTPINKSKRAPLKAQKDNQADPGDVAQVEDEKPRLAPFSDEVLRNIFEHCLEEQVEGCYVAQRSLANLMRVNSVFHRLAGPLLYRSPNVMDLEAFFYGIEKSRAWDYHIYFDPFNLDNSYRYRYPVGNRYTKISLLDNVKQLKILSCLVPRINQEDGEETKLDNHYLRDLVKNPKYQLCYGHYRKMKDAFEKSLRFKKGRITPNLQSLHIGSTKRFKYEGIRGDFINDLVRLEINFGNHMEQSRLELWRRLQPKEVIEYQNDITGSIRYENLQMLLGRGQFQLPNVWTVHTNLLEPFSVIWGCTNRIVLREHTEQDVKWRKIRRKMSKDNGRARSYPTFGYIPPPQPSETRHVNIDIEVDMDDDELVFDYPDDDDILYYDAYNLKSPQYSINIIRNTLIQHHLTRMISGTVNSSLKRDLEDYSTFEIYGFEQVHLYEDSVYDHVWNLRKRIMADWQKDGKVDMDYIEKQNQEYGVAFDSATPTLHPSEISRERSELRKFFKYSNRSWMNSETNENSSEPVIRFLLLEKLADSGKKRKKLEEEEDEWSMD
ncbi:hypothetical protein V865_005213 [Kwoniella europaea PYCC6329]|uniref:F-box domain-containing protein n=1 Tax=Kwoniella europaea PYCC6329 TaxID=1423913 RepID=A0AAX4KKV6_9TREE